jgi:hypothetical protein
MYMYICAFVNWIPRVAWNGRLAAIIDARFWNVGSLLGTKAWLHEELNRSSFFLDEST